MLVINFKES